MGIHAPTVPTDGARMARHVALCGVPYYGAGYLSAAHLLLTVDDQDGVNGVGWDDWCEPCRQVAEANREHILQALAGLIGTAPPAGDYLRRLLDEGTT